MIGMTLAWTYAVWFAITLGLLVTGGAVAPPSPLQPKNK